MVFCSSKSLSRCYSAQAENEITEMIYNTVVPVLVYLHCIYICLEGSLQSPCVPEQYSGLAYTFLT